MKTYLFRLLPPFKPGKPVSALIKMENIFRWKPSLEIFNLLCCWVVSNWRGVYSGNLSSATTTHLTVAEMIPLKGMGLLLGVKVRDYRALPPWGDYGSYSCGNGRASDCIYGCNSSKHSAELHSNNSANVCPLIHGSRLSVHTQLGSDEVSSIQLSLCRGNLLDSQDNSRLRTEGDRLIYKAWDGSQNRLKDCFVLLGKCDPIN